MVQLFVSFLVCLSFIEEEMAGTFILIVFLLSYACLCSVSLFLSVPWVGL